VTAYFDRKHDVCYRKTVTLVPSKLDQPSLQVNDCAWGSPVRPLGNGLCVADRRQHTGDTTKKSIKVGPKRLLKNFYYINYEKKNNKQTSSPGYHGQTKLESPFSLLPLKPPSV